MANVNIVGRREEGKTTLALYLSRRYCARVIWDPRGMIGSPQTAVLVSNPTDLEVAIEEGEWKRGPIIYRPKSRKAADEFAGVCEVLFPPNFTRGGFAFVIDEAGELQTPHGIDDELKRVIKQHPTFPDRESVLVIQTNHRLSEFHNSCKALMNDLYIFQTTLPRDLDVLDEHTGIPEIRDIVRTLPKHHCVHYTYGRTDDGVPQYEVWSNPKAWYIPLKGGAGDNCGSGDPTGNSERNHPASMPTHGSRLNLFQEEEEAYGN